MAVADQLFVQDVRCFQGVQRGILRPITLLVGENSTGKTTFLGCYSVLHRLLSRRMHRIEDSPDFNEEPFSMGSFRDIVRSRRGPEGRINEFKLGARIRPTRKHMPAFDLEATFSEQGSEPVVSSWRYGFNAESYIALRPDTRNQTIVSIPNHKVPLAFPFGSARFIMDQLLEGASWLTLPPEMKTVRDYATQFLGGAKASKQSHDRQPPNFAFPIEQRVAPVAPLRAKPKRTYDPVREIATAEGEHIPMLMMRLDRQKRRRWKPLHDSLTDFGQSAGLFSDIKVRQRGKQISDPFQLQVKVLSGSHANIMDVGYGVSQSLPILVEVLNESSKECVFLLQQPEVHLHPRGQAELASLFIEAVKIRNSRFLIETHSDYIIDRIRISVRNGLLEASNVSILYFEPNINAVKVYQITLDRHGNLEDAPPSYRRFFIKETDKLLGFSD